MPTDGRACCRARPARQTFPEFIHRFFLADLGLYHCLPRWRTLAKILQYVPVSRLSEPGFKVCLGCETDDNSFALRLSLAMRGLHIMGSHGTTIMLLSRLKAVGSTSEEKEAG